MYVARLYSSTTDGDELYNWIFAAPRASWPVVAYLSAAALVVLALMAVRHRRQAGGDEPGAPFGQRASLLLAGTFVLTWLQIVLTKKAGGPHHIMMLYPLYQFLCFAAALAAGRWIGAHLPERHQFVHPGAALVAALAGVLWITDFSSGLSYDRAFTDGAAYHPQWSPLIYQVASYVDRRQVDLVVSGDWGIHNQLLTLVDPAMRAKCVDLWSDMKALREPEEGRALYAKYFAGKKTLVILHAPNAEIMLDTRANFLELARMFAGRTILERVFVSDQADAIFEVYLVDGSSGATTGEPRIPPA